MIYLYFKTWREQGLGDHQVRRLSPEQPLPLGKSFSPKFVRFSSSKALQFELFSPEYLLFDQHHLQMCKNRGFPLVTTEDSRDDPIFPDLKPKYHLG